MKMASPILQRQCAGGKATGHDEKCDDCERTLQRKPASATPTSEVPPIVYEVLASPGQPLDAQTRAFMEPRFGHDFSQVRVHTDAKANESANSVNAYAYAAGQHIVFGFENYRPKTPKGAYTLAHELAHTVQTNMSCPSSNLELGSRNDPAEYEANRVASVVGARSIDANKSAAIRRLTRDEALAYGQSLDTRYPNWLSAIPPCPCTLAAAMASPDFVYQWYIDATTPFFHPGAATQLRSARGYQSVPGSSHGQQCCYDGDGRLITEGPGAGTPDVWSPITNYSRHQEFDVATFNQLGWRIYIDYWRPNSGGCPNNAGRGTRISSGNFRIVGAFDEIDLFLFSVVRRNVTEVEDVQVRATGRTQGEHISGRGHYFPTEVVPANDAAVQLFGGNQPRFVRSYLLQPLP